MKVCIDVEQMRRTADEILILKSDLVRQMYKIETLIRSVDDAWQGGTARMLADKILYVNAQYAQLIGFFEAYAHLLRQFAQTYEQLEITTASKIHSA